MKPTRTNSFSPTWSPKQHVVWWIIGASLFAHLIIFILSHTLLDGWRHEHLPIHTLLEAIGSAIALLVAYKLLSLRRHSIGPRHASRIAQALIVMGLFDGFHAMSLVNNNFVWLHSLATFWGGVFFLLILFPEITEKPINKSLMVGVVVGFVALGSYLFPDLVPAMVEEGHFTDLAKLLNILGGLFLLVAACTLILGFYQYKNVDDLLFAMHCLLFGLAALMFQSSVLWDASWWGWHLLRLCAYGVALAFVIFAETKLLQQFNTYGLKMNELALTDPLTQVHNRRYFDEMLESVYSQAKENGDKLSLVMLDIDHFKKLNDQFGHEQGDEVLVRVAQHVKKHLREQDLLARIGGEEFAFILPRTSKDDALPIVERIRKEVASLAIAVSETDAIKPTASFGIAELSKEMVSEKELLKSADSALYSAKNAGRNQTHIFIPSGLADA